MEALEGWRMDAIDVNNSRVPAFSVIVPAYNVEPYIAECLESLLNQTFQDYELVIVNDGSTDGTLNIIRQYEEKFSDVKVIDQPNKGLSAARNSGLQIVHGKYVYFLDSDDYIETDFLKKAYDIMEKYELDQLIVNEKDFNDGQAQTITNILIQNRYDGVFSGREAFVILMEKNEYTAGAQFRILLRQFLIEQKLAFYEGIVHEDELFSFRVMMCSRRSAICKDIVYYYRRSRPGAITTSDDNYQRRWAGLYVVLQEALGSAAWFAEKDGENTELSGALMNWAGILFLEAVSDFHTMTGKKQRDERNQYAKLLECARRNNYFDNPLVRKICRYPKLYAVYKYFTVKRR